MIQKWSENDSKMGIGKCIKTWVENFILFKYEVGNWEIPTNYPQI